MSLCGTWVLAVDGNVYYEPVIHSVSGGPDRWFLCFDDDEPPELVVTQWHMRGPARCQRTIREIMDRADEILRSLNVQYAVISKRPKFWGRDFGHIAARSRILDAGSIFVKLKSPIPTLHSMGDPNPWILDYERKATIAEAMAGHEACYYLFGKEAACYGER